ncbi:MAG TPA: hypothetical protein VGB77_07185, partial [Abditibacteriaceae bacterium]
NRRVMVGFQTVAQPNQNWESFRPNGVNDIAYHAQTKAWRVLSGTVQMSFDEFLFLAPLIYGDAADTEAAGGITTDTFELATSGERGAKTATVEHGLRDSCDRCPFGFIVDFSNIGVSRDGQNINATITIICQEPDELSQGVPMTGWEAASEIQTLTFAATPTAKTLGIRAAGTTETFAFTPATSNGALETGIEGLDAYAGRAVTITGTLSGTDTKTGVLTVAFDGNVDVPQLEVINGEEQTVTLTNAPAAGTVAGATVTPGDSEGTVQTAIRATGGANANVIVKGSSTAYTPPTSYVVSGAGDAGYNGTYTQSGTHNSQPLYVKDGTHHLYWDTGGQWALGTSAHETSTDVAYGSPGGGGPTNFPLSGWVVGSIGTGPAPTFVANGGGGGNGSYKVYWPVGVDPSLVAVTGTGFSRTLNNNAGSAATTVTETTTQLGSAGGDVTLDQLYPLLVQQASHRRADSFDDLDDATPIDQAKEQSFGLSGLAEAVWFADENNLGFQNWVDGAEPSKEASLVVSSASSVVADLLADAKNQPSTPRAFELRLKHSDSVRQVRLQHWSAVRGASARQAGGNVETYMFPLGPVLPASGPAHRLLISYPTPA